MAQTSRILAERSVTPFIPKLACTALRQSMERVRPGLTALNFPSVTVPALSTSLMEPPSQISLVISVISRSSRATQVGQRQLMAPDLLGPTALISLLGGLAPACLTSRMEALLQMVLVILAMTSRRMAQQPLMARGRPGPTAGFSTWARMATG